MMVEQSLNLKEMHENFEEPVERERSRAHKERIETKKRHEE